MPLLELDSAARPVRAAVGSWPPARTETERSARASRVPVSTEAERAARSALRGQIAGLERQLSLSLLTAYQMGAHEIAARAAGGEPGWRWPQTEPRLLGLAELERTRDELAARLGAARIAIGESARAQKASRLLLERMRLDPGKYKFVRMTRQELGEAGCGAWEVRPRLGLVGMLMGWWRVKLSSGCPLPVGRGRALATLPARGTTGRGTR